MHRFKARNLFVGILILLSGGFNILWSAPELIDVWIGTSQAEPSKGIYYCRLDTETGRLTDATLAAEIKGPGFVAMHPDKRCLYAVGRIDGIPSVAAYLIENDKEHPALRLMNSLEIGDGDAAHLAVDKTGRTLLTAQYGGGSVAVFSLNEDGSLKRRTQIVKHEGGSRVVPRRQEDPHPHWVGFSPDHRFVFVPDLGMDKVIIYALDGDQSRIERHGFASLPPGGGPRHMKFHISGKWIYVLNELSLSVSVFDYIAEAGTMTPIQTIDTVPRQQLAREKIQHASEVRVHPDGRFVYSANRGHDSITVFAVDESTGRLSIIEHEFIRGATLRNFNLDPSGRWLLAAGQHSHTLAAFEVHPDSGELTYNRSIVHIPSPICVTFEYE